MQGSVNKALLSRLLEDSYFALPAPKSTGREQFNLDWLEPRLIEGVSAVDVQATLLALSVQTNPLSNACFGSFLSLPSGQSTKNYFAWSIQTSITEVLPAGSVVD